MLNMLMHAEATDTATAACTVSAACSPALTQLGIVTESIQHLDDDNT